MDEKIDHTEKIVQQWLDSADQNFATMHNLVNSKDYSWALFLGHLTLEKILKALSVRKTSRHAIFTHDLLRLSNDIGLILSEEQQNWLDEITTFNLNARYDSYKQDFYKLCTKEYAGIRVTRIEILRKWLINQF